MRPPEIATILLIGFPGPVADELTAAPPPGGRIMPVPDEAAAVRALASPGARAVCLGPLLKPAAARSLADRVIELDPPRRVRIVILGGGTDLVRFRELVDADRLFYLAPYPPVPAEIRDILHSAIAHHTGGDPAEQVPALAVERLLRLLATLDEEDDTGHAARLCAQAVQALVDADGAECLIFDHADQTLRGWQSGSEEMRRQSPAAGLVGWVARTAIPLRVERVGADPRYEPDADTDGPEERFLAVPAATLGNGSTTAAHGQVHAVLTARRRPQAPPFDETDEATLKLLGEQVAPALSRLGLRQRLRGGDAVRGSSPANGPPLFREEALAHQAGEGGRRARPLALAPAWTRRTYQLLLCFFVVSLAILSWGSVHEYAEGMAVVRVEDRIEVSATTAGIVEESLVSPGQPVEAGEIVVRLDGAREVAELERLRSEFELALADRLRNPRSRGGQGRVGTLREELRFAEARLEERSIRAPASGLIGESRVEVGQPVSPGEIVVTMVQGERSSPGRPLVVAFLPGRYRPLLSEGMPLRLELEGHRGVRHRAEVAEVGDGVIGPAEAGRILGADVADAIPLIGPVVVVRARLSSPTFESGGRTFRYHDGLVGRAEVRVRSEGLVTTLLPGLKGLFGGSDA